MMHLPHIRLVVWCLLCAILPAVLSTASSGTIKNDDYDEPVAALVYQFFRDHKGLKMGIVFTCYQKLLLIYQVLSQLTAGSVPVRTVNMDHEPPGQSEQFSSALRKSLEFHQFVLLHMACQNAPIVLEQASKYELFNASFHWLIIDKNYNGNDGPTTLGNSSLGGSREPTETDWERSAGVGTAASAPGNAFDLFATMNVSMNAEITIARPADATYREFTLYDLWNPGYMSGGKLKVEPLGRYAPAGGLVVERHETTVVRRRNMDGLKLKIMTVVTQRPHQPFERYLTTPRNTHLDAVHRYNYGLMSMLKDFYNFTFVNRRTKSWGYLRNGTFDGMIGALSRREVDLGGSPMFFRQERHRVVSYTTRTFIERPCFIFRHPARQDAVKNPFLLPFETIVWYLMVVWGIMLAAALSFSFYFEYTATDRGIPIRHRTAPVPLPWCSIVGGIASAWRTMWQNARATANFDRASTATLRADEAAGNVSPEAYRSGSESFLSRPKPSPMQRQYWQRVKDIRYSEDVPASGGESDAADARPPKTVGWRWKICHRQYPDCRQRVGGGAPGTGNNCHNKDVHTSPSSSRTHRLQPVAGNDGTKCNYKAEKASKSVLLFLGGVCQQGLSEIPHLSSGRCTSFFILLFGYLMFQYYSASIVGSLLMEQPKSIKTLRGLIDSRLTLGIEDIPYSRDYFVRTTDADSLELYRTRIEYYDARTGRNESHFLPAADGLQLVLDGGYAFHVAISAAYRIIRQTFGEREICELSEIDMFPVSSQWMVAIVQKNSPYRDVITYGLRRLNEAGLMQRQRNVWQEPKPKCVRQIAPTDLIVGLDAVVSAFVLLAGGLALSIGILIGEIFCRRIAHRLRSGPRRNAVLDAFERPGAEIMRSNLDGTMQQRPFGGSDFRPSK
ncbi:ionotropic receptor 75a-like [Anopheles ziemanni]|uniref:ionotropic receptor 75a-like n=1 Tax=Anopheles coustani TaxID=139045 RepID=UPI00265B1A03|nr:ionotropic receptor 75a-like [Anopheles coustani]XP_058178568.1 ionotropic receptor 75a-like [Anopheles ziemanni]